MEQLLIEQGGKLWEGGPHRRVYLNNWLELAGLEVNRYNTGNISSAYLDGEKISNTKASELAGIKCFWDCVSGELVFQGRARMLDEVAARLEEKLNHLGSDDMTYFINYNPRNGITIDTTPNDGWDNDHVSGLVQNMADKVRGHCPLEGAKAALEEDAWAGTDATPEILEEIHAVIEGFEK